MIKAIFISDFTEEFPHHLLSGIVRYSCKHEKWVICRMPPSYKSQYGIAGTIAWAKKWKADAIIGRFDDKEDVSQFEKNGIIALAQDYKSLFKSIANITGDYIRTGQMAARYFINKGFTNFAFYGYKDVVWSDQRCRGFMDEIIAAGHGDSFYTLQNQSLEDLWFYESEPVIDWLKQLPHPTALLTCDDNQGNKIAEICGMAGIKVPDEISILGVDNA
jgi:LacI family transcriptional regulator